MRIKHLIALGVLAVIVLSFAGCNLLATSAIESRLQAFAAALSSSDRSGLTAANFSPTSTINYATADANFWNSQCPQGTYAITDINSADPSNVTATMSGPSAWSVNPLPVSFVMVAEGFLDYRIQEFDQNGVVVLRALTR